MNFKNKKFLKIKKINSIKEENVQKPAKTDRNKTGKRTGQKETHEEPDYSYSA